ncbi:MAG: carboxypeptidase regulatory-like domain-containing protein [Gemmatimonadetes bacterium]|nr:carboxypeptidase regulatory-like domain-containing protein [Gemmatimonadota bacterium]
MRSLRAFLAAIAAVLLALPHVAAAQEAGVLALKVTDPQGAPLAGAAVKIDAVRRGTTGGNGRAMIRGIAPGWHALKVTLIGRRPLAMGMMVPAGGVAELEMGMESAPVTLPGISGTVAVGKGQGAPPRDPSGLGRRLPREALRKAGAAKLSDVLASAPEIMLVRGPNGPVLLFRRAISARQEPPGGGVMPPDCPPAYYVDGVRFPGMESPDVFPLSEIEDVVLFPGNVPATYGGSRASCGVVVIRTRGGPVAGVKPRVLRGPDRGDKPARSRRSPKEVQTMGKHGVKKPGT